MIDYPNGFVPGFPNCGIVAIASVTGASVPDVTEWFRERNNRRSNWQGYTFKSDYVDACLAFGALAVPVNLNGAKPVLWRWCEDNARIGENYILRKRGHVMALHGTTLLDQSKITHFNEHRWRRCKITHIWRVLTFSVNI